MIFLTVGTQLPFDRLVRGADHWAAKHSGVKIQAQIGLPAAASYVPRHMTAMAMVDPTAFAQICRAARLIVAHAGTGSFLAAMTYGVPILAMPRRAALGEHRNDHQMATAARFAGRPGITIIADEADIPAAIDTALASDIRPALIGPFADAALIATIRDAIFATASP